MSDMRRRELDEIEVDILAYLLENGEQRFIQIAEAIFPKHAKAFHQDENHFRVALVRKLDRLREDGFIEKRILSPKNVRYFIPKDKKEYVAEMVKYHRNLEFLSRLPSEEVEKLIKENERLKRLNRIHELEQPDILPLSAVIKKLVNEFGFKIEDFYDQRHLKDPEFKKMFRNFREGKLNRIYISCDKLHNYFMGGGGPDFKHDWEFSPDDIEIKLIPENEVDTFPVIDETTGKIIEGLASAVVYQKFGSGWVVLTQKPIKGHYIIGAYKELLQLYMEQFEDEWLEWKEKFNFSDDDWKRVGPYVAFRMMFDAGRVDLSNEIGNELYEYVQSFNPNGLENLTQMYMRWLKMKRPEAEKYAKDIIEANKKFREQPVEEIWKKYEEYVAKLGNEEWQRIFQYLKAKYGPR
ncbi:MAG: hypothetical protein QXQ61_03025 [Candidatus Bathyarchaeia archaeon]